MHEEIIWELDRCKPKLNKIMASIGKDNGVSKNKALYLEGCALILHCFALEHIPIFEIDLVSVVGPTMLKWDEIPYTKP